MPVDGQPPHQRPTHNQLLIQKCLKELDKSIDEHALLIQLVGYSYPTIPLLWHEILTFLYSTRYLQPRYRLSFSTDLRDRVLSEYPVKKFMANIRLTPEQLTKLARVLSRNVAFQKNNKEPSLEQIIIELKVTLFRLGVEGVPIDTVAFIFGVSTGSVHNYTWRCINALKALADRYIRWPDAVEKVKIKNYFLEHKGFPNCVGAVDGISSPFSTAPTWETKVWNSRKFRYAMGATAVCDHVGRFTFFSTGYFGCFNDSYAYKRTHLHTHPEQFFQGQEYLLADAAYSLTRTVMPRFRNAPIGSPKAKFNSYHGQAQVKVEKAFGMLKRKLQSLKSLPIVIKKERHMYKASNWILACVVIHNFVRKGLEDFVDDDIDENENEVNADGQADDGYPVGEVDQNINNERAIGLKRTRLMNWVLHYRPFIMARARRLYGNK